MTGRPMTFDGEVWRYEDDDSIVGALDAGPTRPTAASLPLLASVVIPVGPQHRKEAAQAVASVLWQTYPGVEAIVVNDTGSPIISPAHPKVRIVDAPKPVEGKRRASVARNAGLAVAQGLFTVFLDADDYLLPSAMQTFVRGHALHDRAYSYGHHYAVNRAGEWAMYRPPEYNREKRASPMSHSTAPPDPQPTLQGCNLHPISAFVPTWCLRQVGGFDEDAPGFEDWTPWIRMAQAGYCGERIYGPVFVYRHDLGHLHFPDAKGGQKLMDAVTAPYRNSKGDIDMGGCGCGGGAKTAKDMARQLASTFGGTELTDSGMVMLEYTGSGSGKQSFRVPHTGHVYQVSARPSHRYVPAPPEDVDYLIGIGYFRRQIAPAPFVPPPLVEPETVEQPTSFKQVEPDRARPKRDKVPA